MSDRSQKCGFASVHKSFGWVGAYRHRCRRPPYSLPVKLAQVIGMAATGVVAVGAAAVVAFVGRIYYAGIDWLVALLWHPVERVKKKITNWPWPGAAKPKGPEGTQEQTREPIKEPPDKYLLVIERRSPQGLALAELLSREDYKVVDEDIEKLVTEELRSAY